MDKKYFIVLIVSICSLTAIFWLIAGATNMIIYEFEQSQDPISDCQTPSMAVTTQGSTLPVKTDTWHFELNDPANTMALVEIQNLQQNGGAIVTAICRNGNMIFEELKVEDVNPVLISSALAASSCGKHPADYQFVGKNLVYRCE